MTNNMNRLKEYWQNNFTHTRDWHVSKQTKITIGSQLLVVLIILVALGPKDILRFVADLDMLINTIFASNRSGDIIQFAWLVTQLGESVFIALATLVTSAILWINNRRPQIIILWLVLLGSTALTFFGKLLLMRPRPETAVLLETSGSLPSGHATIAVAFYGYITYLIISQIKSKILSNLLLFIGILGIALIGWSRLYLGVHYLSDIIAGFAVGFLWLKIGMYLNTKTACSPTPATPRLITSGLLILLTVLAFIVFAKIEHKKVANDLITRGESIPTSRLLHR